ncbi:MAG: hypothetical protein O3A58_00885 [Proteobacteria bacterium]|nr:hypothetical protein [Pseudomonadota bacterium]MDA1056369.1 hypothetical protein [Pseudomonadota bacterium]
MSEYELLNLFYVFLISNGMYFVGSAIFIWLGFRLARGVYDDAKAPLLPKIFISIYCLGTACTFFFTYMQAAIVMDVYATQLIDVGSSAGSRIQSAADSVLAPGGPINWIVSLSILILQLGLVWSKKE